MLKIKRLISQGVISEVPFLTVLHILFVKYIKIEIPNYEIIAELFLYLQNRVDERKVLPIVGEWVLEHLQKKAANSKDKMVQ